VAARRALTNLVKTNSEDPTIISLPVFADTLAQMCIFGYVIARIEAEEDIDPFSAQMALNSVQHPFLKSTLHAVIAPDPEMESAIGEVLWTVTRQVNAAAPILAGSDGDWRRIPYIYEEFFALYHPDDRFKYGVFYTPEEITRFQIREIQSVLRCDFGLSGLNDPSVRYLDPACGTGTYLLSLAEGSLSEAKESGEPIGSVLLELFRDRVVGFEVLPGPAAVAQARLSAWLKTHSVSLTKRFPIFTVNSLAPAFKGERERTTANIWEQYIAAEQSMGDEIKRNQPILVVLGNPPWGNRPRETFKIGQDIDNNLISEWAKGVGAAVINLYDMYVAFWRWACNLLLDRDNIQDAQGIISYITNRSWIHGKSAKKMRLWLRNRDVTAKIVDLGGDIRAGARRNDEPVFAIKAGSAISTLTFGGNNPNTVNYSRIRGTRREKLDRLSKGNELGFLSVQGKGGEPFGPVDWGVLAQAPNIKTIFSYHFPGVKTHRDELVIDITQKDLLGKIKAWNTLEGEGRVNAFHPTSERPLPDTGYRVQDSWIVPHRYRPLDNRYIYSDPRFLNRPGRISKVFGERERERVECLLCLDTRSTDGPVIIATDTLPGYNSFRGSYETHVFPLQAIKLGAIQLKENDLLRKHSKDWAERFGATPRYVGTYILALANATLYNQTFGEALEHETVRMPLTLDKNVFDDATRIGLELLDAWCLRIQPIGQWNQVSDSEPLGSAKIIGKVVEFENGDRLTGIYHRTNSLVISRYPVFQRYLEARSHLLLSTSLAHDIQIVAASIKVILEYQETCNNLLKRAIESQ